MAESTQKLSNELKVEALEVDWRALSGFTNISVHDYLNGIDLEQVWNAITVYLPNLELVIKRLAASSFQDNN